MQGRVVRATYTSEDGIKSELNINEEDSGLECQDCEDDTLPNMHTHYYLYDDVGGSIDVVVEGTFPYKKEE